jgi:hypothetical protein
MARIAILERSDMNAEQARLYDAAKQSSGIVGGPYYAYIRLPRLFEACQNLRASLSSGPVSQREQQIVNLVVARHWNARYPWFAQVRRSLAVGIEQAVIDAINAHGNPNLADAREHTKDDGIGKSGGASRFDWQFFDDLHDSQHLRDRSTI